jgi:hypothetical protein
MTDGLARLGARIARAAHAAGLWVGVAVSLGLAALSLAIAVVVVVGWPADRFKVGGPVASGPRPPRARRVLVCAGKNLAGVVLILLGAVMALPGVPGQGILTMIIGVTVLDLPGKIGFERRLVARPFVLRQLNALRTRFRRPPLELG